MSCWVGPQTRFPSPLAGEGFEFASRILQIVDSERPLTRPARPSPAALVAERLRRGAGVLAKKAGEMRGVGESEVVGDLVDRLVGEHKLTLPWRRGGSALGRHMTRAVAAGAAGVTVAARGRHGTVTLAAADATVEV